MESSCNSIFVFYSAIERPASREVFTERPSESGGAVEDEQERSSLIGILQPGLKISIQHDKYIPAFHYQSLTVAIKILAVPVAIGRVVCRQAELSHRLQFTL